MAGESSGRGRGRGGRGRGRGRRGSISDSAGSRSPSPTLRGDDDNSDMSDAATSKSKKKGRSSTASTKPKGKKKAVVPDDDDEDVEMQDAAADAAVDAASTSKTKGGPSGRRLGTASTATPALVAVNSSAAATDEPVVTMPVPPANKPKFKPNMRRRVKTEDPDDDEQLSLSDAPRGMDAGRGRGRGRGRGKVDVQMTASGPMAQGPSAAPRPTKSNAARPGAMSGTAAKPSSPSKGSKSSTSTKRAMTDDDQRYADAGHDSSGGENDPYDNAVRARDLRTIGAEDEMAPITLPPDPVVLQEQEERRKKRQQDRLLKAGGGADHPVDGQVAKTLLHGVKPEPEDEGSLYVSSNTATPAPMDLTRDGQSTPGHDMPATERAGPDFDLPDTDRERLYVLQFPRHFPDLRLAGAEAVKEEKEDIKPNLDGPSTSSAGLSSGSGSGSSTIGISKGVAPPWGRDGTRSDKAKRFPREAGRMGYLRVHKSGRVSMRINGDMLFDVVPAAEPGFLQEVVVLDHDPSSVPGAAAKDVDEDRTRAMMVMGQTNRKFIVKPDIEALLSGFKDQEKEEEEEKARKRMVKKEKKLAQLKSVH